MTEKQDSQTDETANDEILCGDEIEDLSGDDEKILDSIWEQLRKEKERNNK